MLNKEISKFYSDYDFKKKKDFSDYQFISSWEKNYQSWKNNKLLPTKFFKYEDLLSETFFVFKEIIEFIDKLTNNKSGFNREKAKNAVKTTSFENLKKLEDLHSFEEAALDKITKSKINFINESWMEKKAMPVIIKKIPFVLSFVCISHLYQKNFNLHN